jgi:hypothetical protein
MNYCAGYRTALSPKDITGLQAKYGKRVRFSNNGPIANRDCVSVNDPSDPDGWSNNYVCTTGSNTWQWSSSGPISGMRCTLINEPSDPNGWNNNYLCVPTASLYYFSWSSSGPISGKSCVQWSEGSEPAGHGWSDNYLCY